MSRKSLRIFITSALLVALGSALAVGSTAVGLPTTTVAVEPKNISRAPNELFNITITVADVTELFLWEFNLTFNPVVLEVVSFFEGPFLQQAGYTYPLPPTLNNTGGWVFAGRALFPYPEHGASGSGILAYLTFKAKVEGESDLHFSDTKLRSWDSTAGELVAIPHASSGGFFIYPLWRDVAVTGVAAPASASSGQSVSINVTVKNAGNLSETFDVKTYYDSTLIGKRANVTLQSGIEDVIVFTWDTSGIVAGNYTLKAEATIFAGENDTSNNVFVDGVVAVMKGTAPSPTLPVELLIAVIVVIALGAGGAFLYMRRRSAKK